MPLASGNTVVVRLTGQESESDAFVAMRPGKGEPQEWAGLLTATQRRQAPGVSQPG